MQERCVCNAGNGRREVLAPAINPERGDDLIVFLPNHRFEIGKGWSQPEIPDYFRPSLTKRYMTWRHRVEPLFLTDKRTLLYPQTARRVELLDNAIFEKIQKWRMFPARWELETEDFHGKKISYRGIKYTGSSEM